MKAQYRKKLLYRRSSSATASEMLGKNLAVAADLKGWRLIKHDLHRVFGNDHSMAWSWYVTPALALDGMRPADLVKNGGVQLVREHLVKLEFCVYT